MDIALYISELLSDHDEVGIPGTGTFYKKETAAYFDPEKKRFYPPAITLDFKPGSANGTLITNHVSQEKKISETSASYFVQKFGSELIKKILTEGQATVSPLGVFIKSDSGITFESEMIKESKKGFGLPPIDEPAFASAINEPTIIDTPEPVSDFDETKILEPSTDEFTEKEKWDADENSTEAIDTWSEDVTESSTYTNEELLTTDLKNDNPIIDRENSLENTVHPDEIDTKEYAILQEDTDQFSEGSTVSENDDLVNESPLEPEYLSEEYEEPRRSKWLTAGIILGVIIALGALSYIFYPQINSIFQKNIDPNVTQPAALTPAPQKTLSDSIAVADSIILNTLKQEGFEVEKPRDTVQISTVTTSPVSNVISYEIIAASLQTQSQAEAFIKNMRSKGFDAHIVNVPGKLIKISLGSFKEESSAYNELPRIQKEVNQEAWVFQLKNKTNK